MLYIDKENIRSILRSKGEKFGEKFIDMIKNGIDVHYNFSEEEFKKDTFLKVWFGKAKGQGVKNNSKFSKTEQERRPILPFATKEDISKALQEDWFGIYLLSDKESCENASKYSCILIGTLGEEKKIFEQLKALEKQEEGAKFAKDFNMKDLYKSWEEFCPTLPISDIVMVDPYYFSKKYIYERNGNMLLKVLSSIPKDYPINVVIITDRRERHIDSCIQIKDECEKMKQELIEHSKNKYIHLTIVLTENLMHDRWIITNYYSIRTGTAFCIPQDIKFDHIFEIKLHTHKGALDLSKCLLEGYEKGVMGKVYGDKKSNLICFS
ncbi:MAG TPA: hypothetical protein DDY68_06005 [Porphyromonadaceae bacterium]|nr:hypothetical protein [Porphyromonadaceae bacterium]